MKKNKKSKKKRKGSSKISRCKNPSILRKSWTHPPRQRMFVKDPRIQQNSWTSFSRHRKSLRNIKIRRKTWSQLIRDRNPPTMGHPCLDRKVLRKSKILQHGCQGPKAKMKVGIRFCDLAEWKRSGYQSTRRPPR